MLFFEPDEKRYKIGELAKRLNRSTLTVRIWEGNNLIPKAERDSRGWRYYTEDDIERIVEIAIKTGLIPAPPATL